MTCLVADKSRADRTFVCSENYSSATRRDKRTEGFFKNGMRIIPKALKQIGYDVPIDIPKRYRRQFDMMNV